MCEKQCRCSSGNSHNITISLQLPCDCTGGREWTINIGQREENKTNQPELRQIILAARRLLALLDIDDPELAQEVDDFLIEIDRLFPPPCKTG